MIAGKMMELMDDMAHQRDRLNKRLTRERESRIRSETRHIFLTASVSCSCGQCLPYTDKFAGRSSFLYIILCITSIFQ